MFKILWKNINGNHRILTQSMVEQYAKYIIKTLDLIIEPKITKDGKISFSRIGKCWNLSILSNLIY